MSTPENQFDVRLLHHRFRDGSLSREAYQEYLSALPDSEENAAPTETRFTPSEQDEDPEE